MSGKRLGSPIRTARKSFSPTPGGPLAARRYATHVLQGWTVAFADEAILLVAELASNAAHHAATTFVLSLRLHNDTLLIEVSDGDAAPPRVAHDRLPTAPGGRGLLLVSALAKSWGWRPLPEGGKTVWAELEGRAR